MRRSISFGTLVFWERGKEKSRTMPIQGQGQKEGEGRKPKIGGERPTSVYMYGREERWGNDRRQGGGGLQSRLWGPNVAPYFLLEWLWSKVGVKLEQQTRLYWPLFSDLTYFLLKQKKIFDARKLMPDCDLRPWWSCVRPEKKFQRAGTDIPYRASPCSDKYLTYDYLDSGISILRHTISILR